VINLLLQETDSVPFFLKKEVIITTVDTIPENEFLSFQFLQLDSSKLFYDMEAISHKVHISGMEGMIRPFMQQFGSMVFLVFTFLFVLYAIVFRNRGSELFVSLGNIFSIESQNKNLLGKQVITADVWTNLFLIFQTFIIYSFLFLDLALQGSVTFSSNYDFIVLFTQIFGVIFLFAFSKYLFYQFMGSLFINSKTNDLLEVYLWIIYLAGIISFIPILAYFYIPEVRIYVLYFLFAIFVIGRIIVFAKAYSFFVKSHIGILYFFVYLCALEIMPYLLLYKVVISY